jgi:molybdopterin/thiamine biosynthesis adenylyltransferase
VIGDNVLGQEALRLADRDVVDWTNLQRQFLFEEDDAIQSLPKAEAAVRHLKRINSAVWYESITDDINPGNVERIVTGAVVVIDGLDNFYTRALVNEACVKHGIPWIYGACLGTYGNIAAIVPGSSACLNCLLPDVAQATTPPLSCETVGVLGPVAALVAAWQSAEALKIVVGEQAAVSPHLVYVELWRDDVSTLPMTRNAACSVCGQHKFELLEQGNRLASATLCGRDAVQIIPSPSQLRPPDIWISTCTTWVWMSWRLRDTRGCTGRWGPGCWFCPLHCRCSRFVREVRVSDRKVPTSRRNTPGGSKPEPSTCRASPD